MGKFHANQFPGETETYRQMRDQLLESEISLRKQMEAVAALRRQLPHGGNIKENYVFEEGAADLSDRLTVRHTRISELFDAGKNTLVIYSFMFAPDWEKPCPRVPPSSMASMAARPISTTESILRWSPKHRSTESGSGLENEVGIISGCYLRVITPTTGITSPRATSAAKCRPSMSFKKRTIRFITSTTRNCCMPPPNRARIHAMSILFGRYGISSI